MSSSVASYWKKSYTDVIFALRGQVCGLLTADDIVIVQVNTCRGSKRCMSQSFKAMDSAQDR